MAEIQHVSNQICHIPKTAVAGGLSNVAPTTLGQSMGRAGIRNLVSFAVDKAAVITLYYWHDVAGAWALAGANADEYTKTTDVDGTLQTGCFDLEMGTEFFLTSSVSIANAYVGGS